MANLWAKYWNIEQKANDLATSVQREAQHIRIYFKKILYNQTFVLLGCFSDNGVHVYIHELYMIMRTWFILSPNMYMLTLTNS